MTYRDDRDAMLARAEALEQDLKRAEAERDRLKAQVERLEHENTPAPVPVAPPQTVVEPVQAEPPAMSVKTMVRVHTQALTPPEVKSLLDDVERGFARARSDRTVLKVLYAMLTLGSVGFYFTKYWIFGPVFTVLGIIGIVANVFASALSDAPDVFAVLRDRPGDILELVEGKAMLTIVTRTKSAACSTSDASALLVRLARYCPDAIARRGPV